MTRPFILLMALAMFSCNNNKPPGPTIVAGHLPDLVSSEISTNLGDQEFVVQPDAEGIFQLELDLDWDRYLWFNGINNFLYLVAGDSIFISTDASALHPKVFTGGESAS